MLTGDLPPELLDIARGPGPGPGPAPTLAPPRRGAATDVFERAFAERGPGPALTMGGPPFDAAFRHAAPPHPKQQLQHRHVPFDAAFRDAAPPRYLQHMGAPRTDAMFEQFARFGLDNAHGKAPVAMPHWPPRSFAMPMPLPVRYAPPPPPAVYAQSYATPAVAQEREQVREEGVKSDAQSWGDEFTSLEGGEGVWESGAREVDVQEVNAAEQLRYDDSFEDMYEAAFRDFLGSGAAKEEYRFAEREGEERYGRSAMEALEEGVRLRESGKLAMAVRAFEEALNREADDPHPPLDSPQKAKAWHLLGLTLAETDDDAAAIVALQQGLEGYKGTQVGERRQDSPYLLSSLIALAVSYTNEQVQPQAFGHIKEWFEMWCKQNGVNEQELTGTSEPSLNGTDLEDVFQDAGKAGAQGLLQRMRKASERAPQDADVRIVMGVLHNLQREYTKATETLRYAVMLRPNDPGLWNKLGATLANGGESDDALRAYRRSVDINPALVRAWVNVGTAYANRGEFPKAARYYLKSVSMAEEEATSAHEKGITGTDDRMGHVWGYLRTTLISMSRADILHLVDSRDVKGLRSHFTF